MGVVMEHRVLAVETEDLGVGVVILVELDINLEVVVDFVVVMVVYGVAVAVVDLKMIEKMEELDDVQDIYHNAVITIGDEEGD